MTISSTSNRKEYTGDGATVAFATSPVVFFDEGDLTVYKVTTATGAATLQVLTTDYTVSGGSGSTGTVTMVVAPTAAQTLVIVRELDLVQEVDFVDNEATDAEVSEDALDKLTLMAQQLDAKIDRSVRLADSDVSGASPELPTPAASKLIGWDSAGTALTNYASASIAATIIPTAFMETVLDDTDAATARATLDAQEDVLTTIGDSVVATTAGAAARLPAVASVAAHATTANIWGAREVTLTGTAVTFTDIADAPYAGAVAWVKQNAAHVWTDGAVFDVQGGANYTAAAGDWVRIYATTISTFEVTVFKASGATAAKARTRQVLTSGTAATYTTPAGCIAINVRAVGPGGGGAAQATNSGTAGSGATTFSGGTMSAGAGAGGATASGGGGAGGAASGGDVNIAGGMGQGGSVSVASASLPGGAGGVSVFGGAGAASQGVAGTAAATNSGSGGGGGGVTGAGNTGGGGGAGGYCEKLIASPAATYTYTIGTGGAAGAAGTLAGGAGAAGIIIVDEFYS